MMTIKTGLLVVAIIAILHVLGAPPATDLVFVFIAGGVIPGTKVVVPPEVILFTTAVALMMVFGLLFHLYTKHQATMRTLVPRYKVKRQDPSYTALVPGLGKAAALSKALRSYAKNAPRQLYFWLKYMGHPARIQTLVVRMQGGISVFAGKLRYWSSERARLQRNVLHALPALRKWSSRARAYILRVTTF